MTETNIPPQNNDLKTVRSERTGWRDLELNDRHRQWGYDCPAVDIDLLFIEYDNSEPRALVEYKHERANKVNINHPSFKALIKLGNNSNIPVFMCRYKGDFSLWRVIRLNSFAERVLPRVTDMTEKEWVTFLYKLRGRDNIPPSLFDSHGVLVQK